MGAAGLTAALVLTGCGGGNDPDGSARAKQEDASEQRRQSGVAAQAMTAAAKKTNEAKTAKVSLTVSAPSAMGGDVKMSGVMGWGPMALDVTMAMPGAAESSTMPNSSRLVWVDEAMYVDMGSANVDELGGKRWVKLDLGAALAESGEAERNLLSGGLDSMNGQDPAQQMALLRSSPDIEHVGEQEIDGVATQRYKGTLTMDEALKADDSLDFLSKSEREQLLDNVKKSGTEGYEIEAWVNDDLPVRIKTTMDGPQGKVSVRQKLSDYGTAVSVKAPPADQTVDFREIMRAIGGAGH